MSTITGVSRTKDKYYYYVCGRVQYDGKDACTNNSITVPSW